MAETKVKNARLWDLGWALIIVGAVFAAVQAMQPVKPSITWRRVLMDGHRSGVRPLTADNVGTALGAFTATGFLSPVGVSYADSSTVSRVASTLVAVQPQMTYLKQVVGHSAREMMNDRDKPNLPLGLMVADALRAYGSSYFRVPMDFAITNYGGIRIPMPAGDVTLDDITAMFPFKNYICYAKVKGEGLLRLFSQMAAASDFQATSGAVISVANGAVSEVLIGGKPLDPARVYNVVTIDFLLDGGDNLNIGALAEDVTLSHVLIKDVMLDYVRSQEEIDGVFEERIKLL